MAEHTMIRITIAAAALLAATAAHAECTKETADKLVDGVTTTVGLTYLDQVLALKDAVVLACGGPREAAVRAVTTSIHEKCATLPCKVNGS